MKMQGLITSNYSDKNKISFTAKPIPPDVIQKIRFRVLEAEKIDIFCHSSPDEDTFNSAKVLANWLISQNKKVRIIIEDKLKNLFTKYSDRLEFVDPSFAEDLDKADLAIVVDCNSMMRLPNAGIDFLNKYKKSNIIGLDHHEPNPSEDLIGNLDVNSNNPFYIDTTAKSCCSIIYRLFEGLGIKLAKNNEESLYCGLLSDLNKFRYITIVNKDGIGTIERTDEIKKFPETVDILDALESRLPSGKKTEIIDHLDILSNLTHAERAFQEKLFSEKIQITKNGKLAYIVINPEDQEWKNIGQSTITTSRILSNLRQRLLVNNPDDPLIPGNLKHKLDKLKGVIVFYRGSIVQKPSEETYKLSIHSKDNYDQELIDYIRKNLYPELYAGGHPDRKGGHVKTIDPDKCKLFVNYFVTAADNLD